MSHILAKPVVLQEQEAAFTEMHIGARSEGEGPAVVLLHSSMGSKSQWRTLMEHMRGTHRLIAIDLHGYGDTAMPACPAQCRWISRR